MDAGVGGGETKPIWKERVEHLYRKKWGENTPVSPVTSLALEASPPSLLPPSSLGISPQPPPDHLQRRSRESGSRGNASCKASRRVQRGLAGASSHRLGHHCREEVSAQPHRHFLEALSSATFPCAPISLSTLLPPRRCQVKEGGVGLLDGVQKWMGPSQGSTTHR